MGPSRWSSYSLLFSDFKYTNLGVADCIPEIVHIDRLHVGFALVEVQLLDVALLPLVDVDRLWMQLWLVLMKNQLRPSPPTSHSLRQSYR